MIKNEQLLSKKILILMPVYNEETNIGRTISAVLTQTLPNFTLMIQDNNSSDRTLEIITNFAKQDPRIQIFHENKTIPAHENWFSLANKVPDILKYDFCTWLAGDDLWSNEFYLENLADLLLINPQIGAACPIFRISTRDDGILKEICTDINEDRPVKRIIKLCKNWDHVHHIYGLYKSNVFDNLIKSKVSQFDEYIGSDWWWTYEFLSKDRSLVTPKSVYVKELPYPQNESEDFKKLGKIENYIRGFKGCIVPQYFHLKRLKRVTHKRYLAVVVLYYFVSLSFEKTIRFNSLYFRKLTQKIGGVF